MDVLGVNVYVVMFAGIVSMLIATMDLADPSNMTYRDIFWPECNVIYKFDPSHRYERSAMEAFANLTTLIEENTDVRFLLWKRQYGDDFVTFDSRLPLVDDKYGYYDRGYRITIYRHNHNEEVYFTVFKQILMVLGFTEEQHREDRDKFLKFNEGRFQEGCEHRYMMYKDYPPADIPFSVDGLMMGNPVDCCIQFYCWQPKIGTYRRAFGVVHERTPAEAKETLAFEISRIRRFYPGFWCRGYSFPKQKYGNELIKI